MHILLMFTKIFFLLFRGRKILQKDLRTRATRIAEEVTCQSVAEEAEKVYVIVGWGGSDGVFSELHG